MITNELRFIHMVANKLTICITTIEKGTKFCCTAYMGCTRQASGTKLGLKGRDRVSLSSMGLILTIGKAMWWWCKLDLGIP